MIKGVEESRNVCSHVTWSLGHVTKQVTQITMETPLTQSLFHTVTSESCRFITSPITPKLKILIHLPPARVRVTLARHTVPTYTARLP